MKSFNDKVNINMKNVYVHENDNRLIVFSL
jgi:hypothetical protein